MNPDEEESGKEPLPFPWNQGFGRSSINSKNASDQTPCYRRQKFNSIRAHSTSPPPPNTNIISAIRHAQGQGAVQCNTNTNNTNFRASSEPRGSNNCWSGINQDLNRHCSHCWHCPNDFSFPSFSFNTNSNNVNTNLPSNFCHMSKSNDDRISPGEILKPELDKKEYRAITLKNKLIALLVSDGETDKSAGALSVLAGSIQDPVEIPGLAHFCEHMIFLGTKKFPEENSFQNFITSNGGDCNAYTQRDSTVFFFDVAPTALDGALERFAQFFVDPLFLESSSKREIQAVDSEHTKNIPNDQERRAMVDLTLTREGHPYGKFDCGNFETLWETPLEKSIDMVAQLKQFHEQNYSANLMRLVVIGRQSLDELEHMVRGKFEEIRNLDKAPEEYKESPYGPNELGTMINLVPIMDLHSVMLIFPVPDYIEHYMTGVTTYVGYILSHEGGGSLTSFLKRKRWTTNGIDIGYERPAKGFAFLGVDIDLTMEGVEVFNLVVESFFQYMEMLRREGVQKWLWDEKQAMHELDFRFQEKDHPIVFVETIAGLLQYVPPHDILAVRSMLLSDYKPELITELINLLVPTNMRIILTTKLNAEIADREERWYGARYKYSKISNDLIEKWKNCGLNEEFRFPLPNPLIPRNFDLKPLDYFCQDSGVTPRLIQETFFSRLWFLQDNEFKLPNSTIILSMLSPLLSEDLASYIKGELLTRIVIDLTSEFTADAENAGLWSVLEVAMSGLSISVTGYTEKCSLLFEHILKSLMHLSSAGDRYSIILEDYIRDLENWKDEEPYIHAIDYSLEILRAKYWSSLELLNTIQSNINDFEESEILKFKDKIFSSLKLDWFFHGNYTEQEAQQIFCECSKLLEEKCCKPLTPSELNYINQGSREAILFPGWIHIYNAEHHSHWNSSILILLQCGLGCMHESLTLELIECAMNEPAFDVLRTKEQLGYVVLTDVRKSRGTIGLRVIIQGERDPAYLNERVENFLADFTKTVNQMSEDRFEEIRKALLVIKTDKPKTLWDRGVMIFEEILRGTFNFRRRDLEVYELQCVTLKEMREYYNEWIAPHAAKRKKLLIQVTSVLDDDSLKPKTAPGDRGPDQAETEDEDDGQTTPGKNGKRSLSMSMLTTRPSLFKSQEHSTLEDLLSGSNTRAPTNISTGTGAGTTKQKPKPAQITNRKISISSAQAEIETKLKKPRLSWVESPKQQGSKKNSSGSSAGARSSGSDVVIPSSFESSPGEISPVKTRSRSDAIVPGEENSSEKESDELPQFFDAEDGNETGLDSTTNTWVPDTDELMSYDSHPNVNPEVQEDSTESAIPSNTSGSSAHSMDSNSSSVGSQTSSKARKRKNSKRKRRKSSKQLKRKKLHWRPSKVLGAGLKLNDEGGRVAIVNRNSPHRSDNSAERHFNLRRYYQVPGQEQNQNEDAGQNPSQEPNQQPGQSQDQDQDQEPTRRKTRKSRPSRLSTNVTSDDTECSTGSDDDDDCSETGSDDSNESLGGLTAGKRKSVNDFIDQITATLLATARRDPDLEKLRSRQKARSLMPGVNDPTMAEDHRTLQNWVDYRVREGLINFIALHQELTTFLSKYEPQIRSRVFKDVLNSFNTSQSATTGIEPGSRRNTIASNKSSLKSTLAEDNKTRTNAYPVASGSSYQNLASVGSAGKSNSTEGSDSSEKLSDNSDLQPGNMPGSSKPPFPSPGLANLNRMNVPTSASNPVASGSSNKNSSSTPKERKPSIKVKIANDGDPSNSATGGAGGKRNSISVHTPSSNRKSSLESNSGKPRASQSYYPTPPYSKGRQSTVTSHQARKRSGSGSTENQQELASTNADTDANNGHDNGANSTSDGDSKGANRGSDSDAGRANSASNSDPSRANSAGNSSSYSDPSRANSAGNSSSYSDPSRGNSSSYSGTTRGNSASNSDPSRANSAGNSDPSGANSVPNEPRSFWNGQRTVY